MKFCCYYSIAIDKRNKEHEIKDFCRTNDKTIETGELTDTFKRKNDLRSGISMIYHNKAIEQDNVNLNINLDELLPAVIGTC